MKTSTAPKKRVLIVDDSTAVRQRLVARVNQIEEAEVVGEAGDASEALTLCESLRPDFMTLDLILPGESGVDILGRIKKLGAPPKVIVLTNYPYPAFRIRCLELGAEFFLNKATELDKIGEILGGGGSVEEGQD